MVSDLPNKRYSFELTNMPNVVWADFDEQTLQKGAPFQGFDMESDFEASGDVSK